MSGWWLVVSCQFDAVVWGDVLREAAIYSPTVARDAYDGIELTTDN